MQQCEVYRENNSDCILGLICKRPSKLQRRIPRLLSEFERADCRRRLHQILLLRSRHYSNSDSARLSDRTRWEFIGRDGEPIYNECMIQVTVQDKLKPECTPPQNVTVSCESFDPSLWLYGKAAVKELLPGFHENLPGPKRPYPYG